MLLDVQKLRSWEEQMYWKHFKLMHFCCVLPVDFHDRLVLPQKFAENMVTELPNKVSLFGPSGAMWDVALTKTNNVAFAGDEWKEFVKAYDLKASYLLMFKYKGNVGFEVLIFDPESLCEKETAYFVKKQDKMTTNPNNDDDREKKRSTLLIEHDENNDDDFDFVTSKRARKDTEDPPWTGDTSNRRTPRKCSYGRVKRGGSRGGGKPRKGRISSSHLKAKSGDMLGKKQNGNEGGDEHIGRESVEGNLEIAESPKLNEIEGRKTNESESVKDLNSPENGGSTLETIDPIKCYETRGKKLKESEAAKEQHGTNLEIVHSPMSIELIIGNTPTEIEVPKEQNSPEIVEKTSTIHACKSSGARGRRRKQSAPTKKHLVYENDLLGDKSNTDEAAKEQNGLDTGASTPEMVSDTTSKTRDRSRRQITPNSPSKLKLESAKGWFAKEKANALQRAEQGLTEKSFIAVMRPTAVYKRFYLNIPSDWTHKFLPCRNHEVVLRVGDKTWPALFYYYSQRGAGLAGAGWKKFVVDNNLEEFDVCLVKLASEKGDAATIFDVDIFRVIPETVSPPMVVPF